MRKVKQQIAVNLFNALHEANLSDCVDEDIVNDLHNSACNQADNLYGHIGNAIKSMGYEEQYNRYVETGDSPSEEMLLDNLMRVHTRYVITDTLHLVNPVGYDSSEPVYIQTQIAIYCDEIPPVAELPSGDFKLYIHDVEYLTDHEH